MSTPSMRMFPPAASSIRKRHKVSDDFPAPVRPTIPIYENKLNYNTFSKTVININYNKSYMIIITIHFNNTNRNNDYNNNTSSAYIKFVSKICMQCQFIKVKIELRWK